MERLTVTVPEAAEMLGISRWKAYELVKQGKIPSVNLGARNTRVPVEVLKQRIREMAGMTRKEGQTA